MRKEQLQVGDEVYLDVVMKVHAVKDGMVEVEYQVDGITKREMFKPELLRKKQAPITFRRAVVNKGFR